MRNRFIRIFLFAAFVIVIGYLFNLYFVNLTGDGKSSPEKALPKDAEYEWIEGPKSEKEHRYFFLSNGNYFGTGVVTKNLKGWSAGDGVYFELPKPLEDNKLTSAHSDSKVLYGLIKPIGNIKVTVNDKNVEFIKLDTLSEDIIDLYNVEGYSIWYIDMSQLENKEKFTIRVLDENNKVINELSI